MSGRIFDHSVLESLPTAVRGSVEVGFLGQTDQLTVLTTGEGQNRITVHEIDGDVYVVSPKCRQLLSGDFEMLVSAVVRLLTAAAADVLGVRRVGFLRRRRFFVDGHYLKVDGTWAAAG